MPNKYIIHNATFNGNGTASNEATVDGGVGAWNNINVLDNITTPNYGGGALVAGDTIIVRSKDALGADITRTLSATATLGSTVATSSAWVTWVLDNGVVWSGIDGTLTYNCPSTFVVNARSFNSYVSMTQDALRVVETNAAANKGYWSSDGTKTKGMLFDFSFATTGSGSQFVTNTGWLHEDVHVRSFNRSSRLWQLNSYNRGRVINPDIELLNPAELDPVFYTYDHSLLEVFGGQVRGGGAVSGVRLLMYRNYTDNAFIGFSFPRQMIFCVPDGNNFDASQGNRSYAIGIDNGLGSVFKEGWGLADSRDDNNYPKLNTVLPDTASTPWAWKLCPMTTSEQHPLKMPMSQYFTDTAGTREITVNLLIATTLTNVSKQSVWMTVDYIDNVTGLKKSLNTRDYLAGALDASTANWTATTYGAASLLKRKLSVVTPTAIKPNTPITVVLWSTVKAASTTDELGDIMFLDPEFSVNVP